MRNLSLLAIILVSTSLLSGSQHHVEAIMIDSASQSMQSQEFGNRLIRRYGGSLGGGDRMFNKRYNVISPGLQERAEVNEALVPKPKAKEVNKQPPKNPIKDVKEPAKNPKGKEIVDKKIPLFKDKSAAAEDQGGAAPVGSAPQVITDGLSYQAIAGLTTVGGVMVLVTGLFAFVRRKKNKEMTNSIVSTSATAWEQQNSAYETMDEETKPLGSYSVIATYAPALADELDIQPGDKVTILVEYDDGWVQGINETRGGTKGVFPRHCVDMNTALNGKRSSSIGGYTVVDLN
ncbi:6289_t:CDS:2 [Funneliformis geosporum]|uniref:13975_t:CDS:1 n=1 Tax=Funneliformis geosporum TaxID=1117311 RepID=A0A9W4WUW3_9GLOM|nr:6289_t:CDS:2 [Funneliformis geosporum]CAI2173903.1 13975_t:CDS:2 [Funneliformis geosporum]